METKKEKNANNVYYCTVKDYVFQIKFEIFNDYIELEV